jgi:hypothetical protein
MAIFSSSSAIPGLAAFLGHGLATTDGQAG